MAFWLFGRKKRKPPPRPDEKAERDDDENLGITTQITGPEGTKSVRKGRETRSSSKQPPRKRSASRDIDTSNLPPPPVPPIPERHPSRKATPTLKNPFAEDAEEKAPPPVPPPRQPLSEIKNEELPSQTPPRPPTPPEDPEPKSIPPGASQTSLQAENFYVSPEAPTLRPSRGSLHRDLPRSKSNKRKLDEKARAQEIRSMSQPIPVPRRPKSFTSGLLQRDSQFIPQGLKANLSRPPSEISVPQAESLRSAKSNTMDTSNSFKVNALAALTPHPTLRYSESPRRLGSPYGPSSLRSRKDKGPAIPEEEPLPSTKKGKPRVNELADDMDSTGIREIMERDKRRKERKKARDREKLEKKLQRKLEKQKAKVTGDPGPSGTRDVEMKDAEDHGLGITESAQPPEHEPAATAETSTAGATAAAVAADATATAAEPQQEEEAGPSTREEAKSSDSVLEDPEKGNVPPEYPVDEPTGEIPVDTVSDDERETPILETAREVRLSMTSMSPPVSPVLQQYPRGPSNLSNVVIATQEPVQGAQEAKEVELVEEAPVVQVAREAQIVREPEPIIASQTNLEDIRRNDSAASSPITGGIASQTNLEEFQRKGSAASSRVAGGGWKSFFRRGTNASRGSVSRKNSAEKGRATPSEFSNTSRESFARQNVGPPATVVPLTFQRSKDGVPRRTRSKFKEDLPEYPARPSSRMQSPPPRSPTSPTSPYIDDAHKVDTMDEQARVTTPLGDVHPAFREEMTLSRQSMRSDNGGPSAAMASVDSEGSWISGKPQKRSSGPGFRESGGSLPEASYEAAAAFKADSSDEPSDRSAPPNVSATLSGPLGDPSEYFQYRDSVQSGMTPLLSDARMKQLRRASSIDHLPMEPVSPLSEAPFDNDRTSPIYQPHHQSQPSGGSDNTATAATDVAPAQIGAVHGGQASVHPAPAFQSRELLYEFDPADPGDASYEVSPMSSDGSGGAGTPAEAEIPHSEDVRVEEIGIGQGMGISVHRATSVRGYGKQHARAVSGGSAKILDIPPRASMDSKRASLIGQGSPEVKQSGFEAKEEEQKVEAEAGAEVLAQPQIQDLSDTQTKPETQAQPEQSSDTAPAPTSASVSASASTSAPASAPAPGTGESAPEQSSTTTH